MQLYMQFTELVGNTPARQGGAELGPNMAAAQHQLWNPLLSKKRCQCSGQLVSHFQEVDS